ncbi:MAG TPA: hypothetical protein VJO35_11340 [Terriglobales bacterium]|nr:hypothetical protein [Terriglobales bacterium]
MANFKFTIWNPNSPEEVDEIDAVVDTGTAFSWIRRERLDRLGAQRLRKLQFRAIDGSIIERDTAVVWVGSYGRKVPDIVVVAEAEDKELIGSYTIQGLGLAYDPAQRKLFLTEIPALAFIESLG